MMPVETAPLVANSRKEAGKHGDSAWVDNSSRSIIVICTGSSVGKHILFMSANPAGDLLSLRSLRSVRWMQVVWFAWNAQRV